MAGCTTWGYSIIVMALKSFMWRVLSPKHSSYIPMIITRSTSVNLNGLVRIIATVLQNRNGSSAGF
jgi:hypothetical protein